MLKGKAYRCADGYLERILNAKVYDVASETALDPAPGLSMRLGNTVLLKREDMQSVFSFKIRGAYNKMARLSQEQLRCGVVAASAGNHAQGVALSAQRLGCAATIVMPVTTPQIKVDAVKARGATVVLHGDSYSDAYEYAVTLGAQKGLTFIHPYDDPDVIAGQGTIGMEILRQCAGPLHAVFVPIGGGGLMAGVAAYIKRLRPEVRMIGVEPVDADAMARSLSCGRRVKLGQVGLFADGVAVKQVGRETFRLCRELVDEVILVNTDAMCAAIKDGFEETRAILEAAGALAVAGVKAYVERTGVRGQTLVAIASGANMNFDRLRFVAEVAEIGEAREAIIAFTIPERPGSFRAFCELIGQKAITEFNYRYADSEKARVFVGLQVRGAGETQALMDAMRAHGIEAVDLSANDLAKQHIRHMVGGRAPGLANEVLYRFEFPERPGALLEFLNALSCGWNISLFHYRNHGADYGRVLAGLQIPRKERRQFDAALRGLGYRFSDESENPAYRLFLG